jgi:hypothetical protein
MAQAGQFAGRPSAVHGVDLAGHVDQGCCGSTPGGLRGRARGCITLLQLRGLRGTPAFRAIRRAECRALLPGAAAAMSTRVARNRFFTDGHVHEFSVSGIVPGAPQGGRRSLYAFPVMAVYEVPVSHSITPRHHRRRSPHVAQHGRHRAPAPDRRRGTSCRPPTGLRTLTRDPGLLPPPDRQAGAGAGTRGRPP